MKKVYVDGQLKLTDNVDDRKAIVTYLNGCIEVTFLKPIAHLKNLEDAWVSKGHWGRTSHSYQFDQTRLTLPWAESLLLANQGEEKPLFRSCHTSSSSDDWHGKTDFWYMINERGQKVPDYGEVLENVYVALRLTPDEFYQINPCADLVSLQQNCL